MTEQISIDKIQSIDMAIDADVYLLMGEDQKVEIEAQQNIIEVIETDIKDGMWEIEYGRNVYRHEPVKIYITLPYIDKIILSGSGDIYSEDTFESDEIELMISGSGDIDFSVNTLVSNSLISGLGHIYIEGQTNFQHVEISGSGDYNSYDFLSSEADVSIPGSGNCRLNVSDRLDVSISGSGNVYYKGSPIIHSNISGSGGIYEGN
ncbi:MAG: head GIN domain-containing protein [Ignavibacteriaceae bacterium]|nr:head GIN domain-containing protein [Ignavibacteriaceae bacterium]